MFNEEELSKLRYQSNFLITWNANKTQGSTPSKWVYFTYSHFDGKLDMVIGVITIPIGDGLDFNYAEYLATDKYRDFIRELVGLPSCERVRPSPQIIR